VTPGTVFARSLPSPGRGHEHPQSATATVSPTLSTVTTVAASTGKKKSARERIGKRDQMGQFDKHAAILA